MLNHSLARVLSRRPTFHLATQASSLNPLSASQDFATRRITYPKVKVYNKKSKTGAKEQRRIKRERQADEKKSPLDKGHEMPNFFIASRYNFWKKYIMINKNTHRLARKPIPRERKEAFAKHAREYGFYLQAQHLWVEEEHEKYT